MAESRAYETVSCAKDGLVCALLFPPPTRPHLRGCIVSQLSLFLGEAMQTGAKPSLIGGLTTLIAKIDGLSPDQNPENLSNALSIAFAADRELYDLYLSFLERDPKRAKALLEIFDKVRP